MYRLFNMVDGGFDTISRVVSTHLRAEGRELISEPSGSVEGTTSASGARSPMNIVAALIALKDKYDELLAVAFDSDRRFKQLIASDFEAFINQNERAPEYLSLFVDEKLKRGSRGVSDDEMEAMLDKLMVLFRFLHDKDVFERYYKQHLAKRLLLNRSSSDDAEKSMLAKLKHECGTQFTAKLEGMFKDMHVSRSVNDDFRERCTTSASLGAAAVDMEASSVPDLPRIDLTLSVLTTGFWPMPPAQQVPVLPQCAEQAFQAFRSYVIAHA